jgi:serine/arginine repetitive matrix protein 1
MRPWITDNVIEMLGFEDEVVVELIINLLESTNSNGDGRMIQIELTGFLEDKTYNFMKNLW